MKEKNKIDSLATTLGVSFIISLTLTMMSNATENPFETTPLSDGYMLADGHKHTEQVTKEDVDIKQDVDEDEEVNVEKNQNKPKKSKCNPDKGQNCNEPSW
tara:strand:- start:146 stop:448 length:303 start_codon:yes stop_codon:yes gene_type:complete